MKPTGNKGLRWTFQGVMWGLPLLGLVVALVIQACTTDPGNEKGPEKATAKEYINHHPEAKYVGKDACQPCHQDKYDSYVHSEMGRSWKPALEQHSAADWKNQKPVYDSDLDLYYLPFQVGEALFVKEYRLKGKDTVHARTEKLSFIVGSGQHTNSHLISENGYLYQAPLTWYAQDGKWDLPPGFEDGQNSRFGRSIELECITCHNAMPEYVPGSDNQFTKIPDGIDCERCHGPGSLHIEEKKLGSTEHLIDGIDYSIVHPGKLPVERQFDICQRCHLQGTAVPVEGKTFMDFRPGMKLSDYINTFIPRYRDSLNTFIMASHPDRLRMSDCFLQTQDDPKHPKPMTCVTCHNPHQSIELQGPEHYREVCQSCHKPEGPNFCTENTDLRIAKKDDCAVCHMPRSGSSDIPHVRITDHFIRKPDTDGKRLNSAEVDKMKDFIKLACRTQEKPSNSLMAEGYLAQFEQFSPKAWLLDSADAHLRRALTQQSEESLLRPLVRLRYLQGDFTSLVNLGRKYSAASIQDAWTAYRIGEAFQATGDMPNTLIWFQKAVSIAPAHLRFKTKLASALLNNQQPDQSLKLLNELVSAYSKDPSILNNRGYAYVLLNDMQAAAMDFKKALALNPDNETAMANLASLYLNTGRRDLAKQYTQELLRRNPQNPSYMQLKQALGM